MKWVNKTNVKGKSLPIMVIALTIYGEFSYFYLSVTEFLYYAVIPIIAILSVTFVIYWWFIRGVGVSGERMYVKRMRISGEPLFIHSTIVDDVDSEDYKDRVKRASDMLLSGEIDSENEFFSIIGQRTPKEERIFRAVSDMKAKLREGRK